MSSVECSGVWGNGIFEIQGAVRATAWTLFSRLFWLQTFRRFSYRCHSHPYHHTLSACCLRLSALHSSCHTRLPAPNHVTPFAAARVPMSLPVARALSCHTLRAAARAPSFLLVRGCPRFMISLSSHCARLPALHHFTLFLLYAATLNVF